MTLRGGSFSCNGVNGIMLLWSKPTKHLRTFANSEPMRPILTRVGAELSSATARRGATGLGSFSKLTALPAQKLFGRDAIAALGQMAASSFGRCRTRCDVRSWSLVGA